MKNTLNNNCQRLDSQLCHRFYTISNSIIRAYRPMLDMLDLTYPQYIVLMALWEEDRITVSELHKRTQIDLGSLSLMLKKMITKDMICLVLDEQDKRSKTVHLSAKGKALENSASVARNCLENNIPLSNTELHTLVTLLDKLKIHT